jgi:hypothetical protein
MDGLLPNLKSMLSVDLKLNPKGDQILSSLHLRFFFRYLPSRFDTVLMRKVAKLMTSTK